MGQCREISTPNGDFVVLDPYLRSPGTKRYRANLHCHSTHSDGSLSPDQIAAMYQDAGYRILCIADHNSYSDQDGDGKHDWNLDGVVSSPFRTRGTEPKPNLPCKEDIGREAYVRDYTRTAAEQGRPWVTENWKISEDGRFVVLPGFEDHHTGPHIVVDGYPVEHRNGDIAQFKGTTDYREITQRAGGIVYLAHPHGRDDDPGFFLDDPERRRFDGIEVVNSFLMRHGGKDDPAGTNGFACRLWDSILSARVSCWGYGNDDMHGPDLDRHSGPFGAWTDVWTDSLTAAAVLRALRMGSCCASTGVAISSIELDDGRICVTCENAGHIRFVGLQGRILREADASAAEYEITGDELYVRAECANDERRWPDVQPDLVEKAFSQPFWILKAGGPDPEGHPAE